MKNQEGCEGEIERETGAGKRDNVGARQVLFLQRGEQEITFCSKHFSRLFNACIDLLFPSQALGECSHQFLATN